MKHRVLLHRNLAAGPATENGPTRDLSRRAGLFCQPKQRPITGEVFGTEKPTRDSRLFASKRRELYIHSCDGASAAGTETALLPALFGAKRDARRLRQVCRSDRSKRAGRCSDVLESNPNRVATTGPCRISAKNGDFRLRSSLK
jgi:hypothetical protein